MTLDTAAVRFITTTAYQARNYNMPLVQFTDVTFGYKEDDYLLLRNLSFTVEKNDIITVTGASGCGKSTLFRLMTCLEKEYKGSISINGKSPEEVSGTAAFMPQKDLLMPWRNILKNVTLYLDDYSR